MIAVPADDLVVRGTHLMLALGYESRAISQKISQGLIPPPDAHVACGMKLWRLATIRAWNPAIAETIEQILAIPGCAPRPSRYRGKSLQNAA